MSVEFDWFLFVIGAIAFLYTTWLCRSFPGVRELSDTPTPPPGSLDEVRVGVVLPGLGDETDPAVSSLLAEWRAQQGVTVLALAQELLTDSPAPPLGASLLAAAERLEAVDWLLLCPSPVRPATPDFAARAVQHARERHLDLLGLLPAERRSAGAWFRLPSWTGMLSEIAASNSSDEPYESSGHPLPRLVRSSLWERAVLADSEAFAADPRPLARLDAALRGARRNALGTTVTGSTLEWAAHREPAISTGERLYLLDSTGYRAFASLLIGLGTAIALLYGLWECLRGRSFWGVFALTGLCSFILPAWHMAPLVRIPRAAALVSPLVSFLTMLRDVPLLLPPALTSSLHIDGRRFPLAALRAGKRGRREE